jgi:hypothetical protein
VFALGNSAEGHFAITGLDSAGEMTALLVNTTSEYEGVVPLDFPGYFTGPTTRLEITAEGRWYIEIRPTSSARPVDAPGSISWRGDEVLMLVGSPDTALVSGNQEESHFAVQAYNQDGPSLLVNTTDAFEGRVIVPADTEMMVITAEGDWEITFE